MAEAVLVAPAVSGVLDAVVGSVGEGVGEGVCVWMGGEAIETIGAIVSAVIAAPAWEGVVGDAPADDAPSEDAAVGAVGAMVAGGMAPAPAAVDVAADALVAGALPVGTPAVLAFAVWAPVGERIGAAAFAAGAVDCIAPDC